MSVWSSAGLRCVRPTEKVEDVDALLFPDFFGLLGCHGLHFDRPLGEFSALDGFEEILLGIVR